jgi:hypothetical protein
MLPWCSTCWLLRPCSSQDRCVGQSCPVVGFLDGQVFLASQLDRKDVAYS